MLNSSKITKGKSLYTQQEYKRTKRNLKIFQRQMDKLYKQSVIEYEQTDIFVPGFLLCPENWIIHQNKAREFWETILPVMEAIPGALDMNMCKYYQAMYSMLPPTFSDSLKKAYEKTSNVDIVDIFIKSCYEKIKL